CSEVTAVKIAETVSPEESLIVEDLFQSICLKFCLRRNSQQE
ncbi:unnamed protein product, partial [Allacma fusca]